jgi:phosphoribosylglycinamide formyltransferase-1
LAFATREEFDSALMDIIDQFEPDLVVLAGFMRILSAAFVSHYAGRLLNIHPSLLPDFAGVNTHQRALDAKVTRHGASVHFVTEELDGGPVIARHSVPVTQTDTAESLAARVLQQEHTLYPKVVAWFAAGELRMTDSGAQHTRIPLPDTQDFD